MATTTSTLGDLEPRSFWGHFEALTTIAPPSRREERVIEHIRSWSEADGFELQDDAGPGAAHADNSLA